MTHGATIIMTGSAHHSITGELLGSDVSWSVIQHSPVPVLLVPLLRSHGVEDELCVHQAACRDLLDHVLFPTDFSENADIAFPVVELLAQRGARNVTLLHVQDSSRIDPHLSHRLNEFNCIDEQRLRELGDRIEDAGSAQVSNCISYGRPVPGILRIAKEINSTCLVPGRYGRGTIAETILGSVSHNIVRNAEAPVLVVPHEA